MNDLAFSAWWIRRCLFRMLDSINFERLESAGDKAPSAPNAAPRELWGLLWGLPSGLAWKCGYLERGQTLVNTVACGYEGIDGDVADSRTYTVGRCGDFCGECTGNVAGYSGELKTAIAARFDSF